MESAPVSKAQDAQKLAETVVSRMYALDRVAPGLGVRVEQVRPRYARIRMTVREDMINAVGICHGGAIFTLADCAFAYACNSENKRNLATHCSISFAAAAKLGEDLVAVAEECIHQSRIGVYDVRVTGDGGRVIAVFRGQSYQVSGESVAIEADSGA
jgi:acyl-CoA thioesterase